MTKPAAQGAWGNRAAGRSARGPSAAARLVGACAYKICFFETPFIVTVSLKFSGDELIFDSESNVVFGATKQQQLVGKAKPN